MSPFVLNAQVFKTYILIPQEYTAYQIKFLTRIDNLENDKDFVGAKNFFEQNMVFAKNDSYRLEFLHFEYSSFLSRNNYNSEALSFLKENTPLNPKTFFHFASHYRICHLTAQQGEWEKAQLLLDRLLQKLANTSMEDNYFLEHLYGVAKSSILRVKGDKDIAPAFIAVGIEHFSEKFPSNTFNDIYFINVLNASANRYREYLDSFVKMNMSNEEFVEILQRYFDYTILSNEKVDILVQTIDTSNLSLNEARINALINRNYGRLLVSTADVSNDFYLIFEGIKKISDLFKFQLKGVHPRRAAELLALHGIVTSQTYHNYGVFIQDRETFDYGREILRNSQEIAREVQKIDDIIYSYITKSTYNMSNNSPKRGDAFYLLTSIDVDEASWAFEHKGCILCSGTGTRSKKLGRRYENGSYVTGGYEEVTCWACDGYGESVKRVVHMSPSWYIHYGIENIKKISVSNLN